MKKATIYDYARLCKSHGNCEGCPLSEEHNGHRMVCSDFCLCGLYTDEVNEIILKWCEEHPKVTRQDRLLNVFPNAKVTSDYLDICPQNIDKTYTCKFNPDTCDKCKRKYWFAEVKE